MHACVPRWLAIPIAALLGVPGIAAEPSFTPEQIAAESRKANDFFERVFHERVDRSPEFQTRLGIKKDYDKWDDDSELRAAEDFARRAQNLFELQRDIRFAALDPQTQLSYRLWIYQAERAIEGYKWRHHNYPVNQMFGQHTGLVAFLVNLHRVTDVKDAQAYIARLNGLETKLDTLVANLEVRRAKGIVPPRFVFPLVLESSRGIISGEPFDTSGKPCALLEDITKKVGALAQADAPTKERLIADAKRALVESVQPAYRALIAKLEALERVATDEDGAWKFPEGDDFYNFSLRSMTTTPLNSDEIHALGLREVARIHSEMDQIKAKVKFAGDRAAFFKFMREDPQFHYPDNAEGKAAYLKRATEIIDTMRGRLDELFLTKPKATMIVKAVEPFRERESGGAFYQQPAVDGSRPGTYYVNLHDMAAAPKYEMEALAYHEGLQTIDWLTKNTPNSERDILTETNRYIVMPGQATAYKIGMMKILDLRALARRELGARFDIREFHDVVLKDGGVPLDVLEENVRTWIARQRG